MDITFMRLPAVQANQGLKKSAIYSRIAAGLFPKPVSLGGAVAWLPQEIQAVNAARVAGKSEPDVRDLVARLHAQRGGAA